LRGVQLSGCELTVGQAVQLAHQEILAGGAKGVEQGFGDIRRDVSVKGCGAFEFSPTVDILGVARTDPYDAGAYSYPQ
jgi:hypothetical protein